MIHYLYAYSATLDKEVSQFGFFGAVDAECTEHTTEKQAQTYADEFASMLNADAYLSAADWTGKISTVNNPI